MLFLCCPNWQHLYFIPLEQIFIRQYLSLDMISPLLSAEQNLARQMERTSYCEFLSWELIWFLDQELFSMKPYFEIPGYIETLKLLRY